MIRRTDPIVEDMKARFKAQRVRSPRQGRELRYRSSRKFISIWPSVKAPGRYLGTISGKEGKRRVVYRVAFGRSKSEVRRKLHDWMKASFGEK